MAPLARGPCWRNPIPRCVLPPSVEFPPGSAPPRRAHFLHPRPASFSGEGFRSRSPRSGSAHVRSARRQAMVYSVAAGIQGPGPTLQALYRTLVVLRRSRKHGLAQPWGTVKIIVIFRPSGAGVPFSDDETCRLSATPSSQSFSTRPIHGSNKDGRIAR